MYTNGEISQATRTLAAVWQAFSESLYGMFWNGPPGYEKSIGFLPSPTFPGEPTTSPRISWSTLFSISHSNSEPPSGRPTSEIPQSGTFLESRLHVRSQKSVARPYVVHWWPCVDLMA